MKAPLTIMALLCMTLSIGCMSRVKVSGGGWTSSDGTKCIAVNGYSALGTSYLLPTTKKLEVLAYGPIDESGNRTLEARKMFTIKQASDMTWTCAWESETAGRIFVFDYANESRNAARKNGTRGRVAGFPSQFPASVLKSRQIESFRS